MIRKSITAIFLITTFITGVASVDFILKPNVPTCTILISSFDPIKVEAIFPSIGSKQEGQQFKIELTNQKTGEIVKTLYSDDNRVFRENFYLQSNIIHSLCIEFITKRDFGSQNVIFVGFVAQEHFQSKIGKIQIPKELANEENLKIMYETSMKMLQMNENTITSQKRERELEDKLVDLSLHKGTRIIHLTIFECFAILVSGIYQIFALRKFLIEKNLY